MRSLCDTPVYARRPATPWARLDAGDLLRDLAANGAFAGPKPDLAEVVLRVRFRSEVARRL